MTELAKPVVEKARWVDISLILPVRNESDCLEEVHRELKAVLETMHSSWEIIFVDDGSTDDTRQTLHRLATGTTRAIVLARSFGQTAALAAGVDAARGGVIVTMDADGRSDPAEIPRMVALLGEGYEVVSGWRYARRGLPAELFSRLAGAVVRLVTGVGLHDFGCSLRAYDRKVFETIRLGGEMRPFIPALAWWMGAEVAEIKVNHRPPLAAGRRRRLSHPVRVLLDLAAVKLMLSNAARPIQFFGKLGLLSLLSGVLCGAWVVYQRLAGARAMADNPLLLVAVLLLVAAAQFISMGLVGEIAIRAYHESQSRPLYYVKETLG